MARIRSIKPDFCSSGDTAKLSRDARLFLLQLLTEADDEGRLIYSAKKLSGVLYPHDDDVTAPMVDGWVSECEARQMLQRYDVDGTKYLCITNFSKHQVINHKTASKLPAPPSLPEDSRSATVTLPEDSREERKGKERNREQGTCDAHVHTREEPEPSPKSEPAMPSANTHTEQPGEDLSGSPEIPPREETPPGQSPKIGKAEIAEQWQQFCETYPRRNGSTGKAKAEQKFGQLAKLGLVSDILAGALRYRHWADATLKTGTEFVCQMTTWLHQKRWTEEYEIPDDASPPGKIVPRETRSLVQQRIDRMTGVQA